MIALELADLSGARRTMETEHVIAATGFKAHRDRLGLLSAELRGAMTALPDGSPQQRLARLNQATEAYLNRDYGLAERLYDAAAGEEEAYSDVYLHAFRGDTYQQVGRDKDAAADARIAWLILSDDPAYEALRQLTGPVDEDARRFLMTLVLPILKKSRDPAFEAALALYRKRGFVDGAPFGDYAPSDFNQFLHLGL